MVQTAVKYTPLNAVVETDIPFPPDYLSHAEVFYGAGVFGASIRLVIREKILRGASIVTRPS